MMRISRRFGGWPGFVAVTVGVLAVSAVISACRPPASVPPTLLTRTVLQDRVGPSGSTGPIYCRRDRVCGSDVLPGFYRQRDFRPAWIDDDLALGNARAFVSALRRVAGDGLEPANYHLAAIDSLLAGIERQAGSTRRRSKVAGEDLADLEMLLTDGFLLCGSHLVHGQLNPETLEPEWSIKGRVADLAAALERGLASGDIPGALDSLRPRLPAYQKLRTLYARYVELAAGGGWPGFPPGPKLVKGDADPRVGALRKALEARGDLPRSPGPADPDLFDDALEAAVKSFQSRHGLDADGVVGGGTATALAVPAAERLRQIKVNLERWRWVTEDLGATYVRVNIAGFEVTVVDAGREVLSMEAIVGRDYRQTPDFNGRITTITINPAWNVPPLLAREDILPQILKDQGYLHKNNIRVFESWNEGAPELDPATIDWSRIAPDDLRYKFRQDPGPQNALGQLAFYFSNKFGVYLHDTPARGLFLRADRDASSGCIRLEKALDLAAFILRNDPDWTRDKIVEAIASGEKQNIRVDPPTDVLLLYWTAWLDDMGKAQFRQDIYLRDAAVSKALDERAAGASSGD